MMRPLANESKIVYSLASRLVGNAGSLAVYQAQIDCGREGDLANTFLITCADSGSKSSS